MSQMRENKTLFPTDYRDPAEHEDWLERHPGPVYVDYEPDYEWIDRVFERIEKMMREDSDGKM